MDENNGLKAFVRRNKEFVENLGIDAALILLLWRLYILCLCV